MSERTYEYVRSIDLARLIEDWLRRKEMSIDNFAERAGVSARAITKTLRRERPYQSIFFADKVMMAMDLHICELKTVSKPSSANGRENAKRRIRSK